MNQARTGEAPASLCLVGFCSNCKALAFRISLQVMRHTAKKGKENFSFLVELLLMYLGESEIQTSVVD